MAAAVLSRRFYMIHTKKVSLAAGTLIFGDYVMSLMPTITIPIVVLCRFYRINTKKVSFLFLIVVDAW